MQYFLNKTIFSRKLAKSKCSIMPHPMTYFSPTFPHPNSTGKELDAETGYGYFGARYYDATLLTSWTAVDPMADKYPSLSPYNYCAWNPMKLVDPDGEEIFAALISAAVKTSVEIVSQTISNGLNNLNNGKGFFEDWGRTIDWMDVGISAVEGFLDGAVPGLGRIGEWAIDGGAILLKSSMDITASESSNGEITFTNVLGQGEHKKSLDKFGIDLLANVATYTLRKASNIDDIPLTKSSFGECAYEVALRGSTSAVISTPFAFWKSNATKQSGRSNNYIMKVPEITVGPLEIVEWSY